MVHNYTKDDLLKLVAYKCAAKAKEANKRFADKITKTDVLLLLRRFNFKCLYCGTSLSSKTWELDHFYSRYMGGKNKPDNLVSSCKRCNAMKGLMDGFSFIRRCEVILERNMLKNILNNK